MKITIEIWQSEFNEEWHCDIKTTKDPEATEYWAVENFCALLQLIGERFPKAKIVANPPPEYSCENCGGTGFIYQGDLSEPVRCGYGCREGKL